LGVVLVRTVVAEGAVALEEVLADGAVDGDAVAELAPQEVVECEVVKRRVWLGWHVGSRDAGRVWELSTAGRYLCHFEKLHNRWALTAIRNGPWYNNN